MPVLAKEKKERKSTRRLSDPQQVANHLAFISRRSKQQEIIIDAMILKTRARGSTDKRNKEMGDKIKGINVYGSSRIIITEMTFLSFSLDV